MYKLYICTTAINRPDMHNLNMPEWYDWISKIKNHELYFFINIDIIKGLNFTYSDTKNNFDNLLKNITTSEKIFYLKSSSEYGNFQESCKRIVHHVHEHINNNNTEITENAEITDKTGIKILWLEDDWKLRNDIININEIIKYIMKYSYISLSNNRNHYLRV